MKAQCQQCGSTFTTFPCRAASGKGKFCSFECYWKHKFGTPVTHGATSGGNCTPEYRSWKSMRARCTDHNNKRWNDYGGRGIAVCQRWTSFDAFLADMGNRPQGTSLDRIDVNGNYDPSNCRWATPKQQQNNMRSNRKLSMDGTTRTIAEWARTLGMHPSCIRTRVTRGWSVKDALTVPPMPYSERRTSNYGN